MKKVSLVLLVLLWNSMTLFAFSDDASLNDFNQEQATGSRASNRLVFDVEAMELESGEGVHLEVRSAGSADSARHSMALPMISRRAESAPSGALLKFQIALNLSEGLLEYLEVLNLYNCETWYCSAVPGFSFAFSVLSFFMLPQEKPITVPSVVTHLVGAAGLFFWDTTYWNVATRHRTEYYDTHDFYAGNLWLLNFWTAVYLYLRSSGIDEFRAA